MTLMEIGDLSREERRLARDRRQPSRDTRDSGNYRRGTPYPGYALRTGRMPWIAILDRDFAFASVTARLAEQAGLAVSVFWTMEELLDAPSWRCDVLVVDKASWHLLELSLSRHINARFAATTIEVVGEEARRRGPQSVLEAVQAGIASSTASGPGELPLSRH